MSKTQKDYRVRLGPEAEAVVEAVIAQTGCSRQDAVEGMISRAQATSSGGAATRMTSEDRVWIYTTLGEFMAEAAENAERRAKDQDTRLYAVEQSLNLMRLLIAALLEERGTEDMKEIMRDITSMLDNVIRPLEKDPMKVMEDVREQMRQRNLLMDGQAVRNQEGGDGREVDELEDREPDRDL